MKRLSIALFFILASFHTLPAEVESSGSHPRAVTELDLRNCSIMLTFARIWKYSPLVEKERAVWIIVDSDGEYAAIDWLHTPQRNRSVWDEALPEGIVAQAHTHGDHLNPKPSKPDVSIARQLKVPVYTLTRKGIWRASPSGVISKEAGHEWYKRTLQMCEN